MFGILNIFRCEYFYFINIFECRTFTCTSPPLITVGFGVDMALYSVALLLDILQIFHMCLNATPSPCGMTCQERAGSFQSVQNGLPDPTAGVFTDSCCYPGIYNRLCPHDCCSGKTHSHVLCVWGGVSLLSANMAG